MKLISKTGMILVFLLSVTNTFAQIKNLQTTNVKISGNCEMCRKTIETAANVKGIAQVTWNKDTKLAMVDYNSQKTNTDEILKRIALAGYDNALYLAPDEAYAKLPACCQYERSLKPVSKPIKLAETAHNHQDMPAAVQNVTPLKTVFDHYFSIKDALVKTDANTAALEATALQNSIKAVEMNKLSTAEHTAWMAVVKDLSAGASRISKSKDVVEQRRTFSSLSEALYPLAKVVKSDTPVYYQHCPMYNNGKGANWLSKESTVKNPFYGSKMLTCGSTIETLK